MVISKQVQPCPAYVNQPWHRHFAAHKRSTLIHNLIKAIKPQYNPSARVVDSCVQNVVTFVKHFEVRLFESCSFRTDYLMQMFKNLDSIRKINADQIDGKYRRASAAPTIAVT